MARKRDFEPWDTTRYSGKKCAHGHEGRIGKLTRLCAGCLEEYLARGGFQMGSIQPQEARRREETEKTPRSPSERVVLVCGSRKWTDRLAIWDALFKLRPDVEMVIHGAARGADRLAGDVCKELGIPVREFPADWERYGKGAGFIRNSRMLKEGQPDLVLAFTEELEGGTGQMVKLARKAGVEVRVYGPRTSEAPALAGASVVSSEG